MTASDNPWLRRSPVVECRKRVRCILKRWLARGAKFALGRDNRLFFFVVGENLLRDKRVDKFLEDGVCGNCRAVGIRFHGYVPPLLDGEPKSWP